MSDVAVAERTHVHYSDELANRICERLEQGESMRRICATPGFPAKATVMRWLRDNPVFRDMHAQARLAQLDSMADDLIEIADDARNDFMEALNKDGEPTGGWEFNKEAVLRSRLRIDTRKWILGKMLPRRFGATVQIQLPEGAVFPGEAARVVEECRPSVAIEDDPLYLELQAWDKAVRSE